MNYQGFTANEGNNPTSWQNLISNLTLAQNAQPNTMLGFVLGKYLKDWYDNYQDRGWRKSQNGGINSNLTKQVMNGVGNQVLQNAVQNGASGAFKQGLLSGLPSSAVAPAYADAAKAALGNSLMQQAMNSLPSGSDFRKRYGNGVNYTNGFNSTTYF